jgi:hypothetical protein
VIRLLKESVIPVSYPGLTDNGQRMLTANGKELSKEYTPIETLKAGLKKFRDLPESEKRPDAASLAEIPGFPEPPAPPVDGLILRSYIRGLNRAEDGSYSRPRRIVMRQGVAGNYGWKCEPNLDYVWLRKEEWQSLIPAQPRKGQSFPVPAPIVQRFVTFHLIDSVSGTPNFFWADATGKMTLTVDKNYTHELQLRLDGTADADPKHGGLPVDFLGYIHFDRRDQRITRFDLVALSRGIGDRRDSDKLAQSLQISYQREPGSVPVLAFAFEMVTDPRPVDRVPPYAIMYNSAKFYNLPYFTGK